MSSSLVVVGSRSGYCVGDSGNGVGDSDNGSSGTDSHNEEGAVAMTHSCSNRVSPEHTSSTMTAICSREAQKITAVAGSDVLVVRDRECNTLQYVA